MLAYLEPRGMRRVSKAIGLVSSIVLYRNSNNNGDDDDNGGSSGDSTNNLKNSTDEYNNRQWNHDSGVAEGVTDHRNALQTGYP